MPTGCSCCSPFHHQPGSNSLAALQIRTWSNLPFLYSLNPAIYRTRVCQLPSSRCSTETSAAAERSEVITTSCPPSVGRILISRTCRFPPNIHPAAEPPNPEYGLARSTLDLGAVLTHAEERVKEGNSNIPSTGVKPMLPYEQKPRENVDMVDMEIGEQTVEDPNGLFDVYR